VIFSVSATKARFLFNINYSILIRIVGRFTNV